MQQLSGLDAAFLYVETGNMPMHIGSLAIYDQSTAPGGHVGFKDILQYFRRRMHKARSFRQRLARVPLSLDHPYWIEDPDFDLEFHIRHIALPRPGDWRQLCIQTARLHARPLDRNRPLWEAYVIEGLDNVDGVPKGSFALMTKFHHAAVDGVSAAQIASAFHDLGPVETVEPPTTTWHPDRLPTGIELLGRTVLTTAKKPLEMAGLLARNASTVLELGKRLVSKDLKFAGRAPRTRFNGSVSAHRVFDGRRFDLEDFRAARHAVSGATINDVVVAVCGGALRRYLQDKNELPEQSLLAMAPVSVRPTSKRAAAGNMVATMSLPVGSHIGDPLERLKFVNYESVKAKELTSAIGPSVFTEAAQFLPSTTTGLMAQAYGRYGLARHVPPIFNTVITNVPGSKLPLYSMGSRMVASFGLGPVAHGLGLFQPVVSYDGTISISAVSCREMMPDPSFYCDCLEESLADLGKAIARPRARKTPVGVATKKPLRKKAAKKTRVNGTAKALDAG